MPDQAMVPIETNMTVRTFPVYSKNQLAEGVHVPELTCLRILSMLGSYSTEPCHFLLKRQMLYAMYSLLAAVVRLLARDRWTILIVLEDDNRNHIDERIQCPVQVPCPRAVHSTDTIPSYAHTRDREVLDKPAIIPRSRYTGRCTVPHKVIYER